MPWSRVWTADSRKLRELLREDTQLAYEGGPEVAIVARRRDTAAIYAGS